MAHPPACDAHRALVDAAMGPAPDDETLARYAEEVVPCEDCRRLLAIRVGAHPGRFAAPPAAPSFAGMESLGRALGRRRRLGRWAAGGAGLAGVAAAAALAALYLPGAPEPPPTASAPAPGVVHAVDPGPPAIRGRAPPPCHPGSTP